MKTAVSLPDELFAEAEALAHRKRVSRSRLYTEALREYLARHEPNAVTVALNAVYATQPSRLEPSPGLAAERALERSDW